MGQAKGIGNGKDGGRLRITLAGQNVDWLLVLASGIAMPES
jgi:hypothetical protein